MADREVPLRLVIKAVDKATAPLRQVNERINRFTAPVRKLNNSFRALAVEARLPQLAQGFGRVGREVASLGLRVGALAGVAGFAFARMTKNAIDAGDELATMADRVGLSVDDYAQLRFAAEQADVEQSAFNTSMDQFNKRLGEAKAGTGPLVTLLNKASPALLKQLTAARSNAEAFDLMVGAMTKLDDPSKRAALSSAAFGRSGLAMAALLAQGTEEIDRQKRKFLELSGSQEDFARRAGVLDNTLRESRMAFEGIRNAALAELFPALSKLFGSLTTWLVENRERIGRWAEDFGERLPARVESFVAKMRELRDMIAPVLNAVGGLTGALKIAAVLMAGKVLIATVSLAAQFASLAKFAIVPAFVAVSDFATGLRAGFKPLEALKLAMKANPAVAWTAGLLGAAAAGVALGKTIDALLLKPLWERSAPEAPVTDEEIAAGVERLRARRARGELDELGRPTLDAEGARPRGALGAQRSEAHVTVDFRNAPRGTRVERDPRSTVELDTSLGLAMSLP